MLARLATCLLVISIGIPAAFADRANRTVASCTSFEQVDKDDETVQFTIKNSCTVPVDCEISWKVVCAPESKKRRATHAKTQKFALSNAASQTAEASATVCGDASWTIEAVEWSCAPNKD
ncbi:MAG: hypothetical protein H0T79_03830 [Deltaproteobacteria bacterium]|nr:hypothetical protein [Deltaproteobacteria bacterium]